ncbi:BCCT family transporter [Kiloniella sp. b19]|uniref:BCCT family transporter n=1 Tax=Kiloniella sp. GXU_MW_B19 TaxID=3141326 RepID=UPI0031D3C3C7
MSDSDSKKVLYDTDYEAGQDNLQRWGIDVHNPVFWIASAIVILFVLGVLIAPGASKELLDGAKWSAIGAFDWLFMLGGNIFVLFCLALIVLPHGKIRLGGAEARPEFSTLSWFAMLFAAGMGIGLMFWSVAEPTAYYTGWYETPLGVEANTPEAAQKAMNATMFHWGLHPWAIYAVVGLSLAFFSFNKGLPLTIRSAFYPILKDHSWGFFGHIVDIVAVVATLFGLATSLGFGAQQASAGLAYLFDFEAGLSTQIAIIVVVTLIALFSVVRGLDGGVKILSNINMGMATILVLFIFVVGPTAVIISTIGTTFTGYLGDIVSLSNWVDREDEAWMQGWTVFYWAWWISWSPFVGMFIARISKGRTVREFIVAVLLVPTLVTLFWMSVFGGSALDQIQNGVGELANGLGAVELAMFQMLENLPLAVLTSTIGIVLVLVFFITSSDSGSLVIDAITAGGKVDAPVIQRIFWVIIEGMIAAALLFGGGADALAALQAAAITTGLPFTVILIVMCVCLFMGLSHEKTYVVKKDD